jgi:hypothetical protein
VLDGQILSYFETFDLSTGEPTNLKGEMDLSAENITIIIGTDDNKLYTFAVKSANRELLLQADDEKGVQVWMKALGAAVRNEIFGELALDYEECYSILELDFAASATYTVQEVNKAYRKKALKCHPDKGGDLVEFKKTQEAFDAIGKKKKSI